MRQTLSSARRTVETNSNRIESKWKDEEDLFASLSTPSYHPTNHTSSHLSQSHLITAQAIVDLLGIAFDDGLAARQRPLQNYFVFQATTFHTLLSMRKGVVISESKLELNLLLGVGYRLANILGRVIDLIRNKVERRHGRFGRVLLLVGGLVSIMGIVIHRFSRTE